MRIILTNAQIWGVEGDTLVIRGDKVEKIGFYTQIAENFPGYKVVDLAGRSVLPPLHDSHTHIHSLEVWSVDLRGVRSVQELQSRLSHKVREGPPFIVGRGWDENMFDGKETPTRWDLDEVTKDIPTMIIRVCGHVAVVNTALIKLMEKAGILEKILQAREISKGDFDGMIYENEIADVKKLLPRPCMDELKALIQGYLKKYVSFGVQYLNIMSVGPELLEALGGMTNALGMRIGIYLDPGVGLHRPGFFGDVRICGYKDFADGSFGGRTAKISERYRDKNTSGVFLLTDERVAFLTQAAKEGHQIAIHAIGDEAVRRVVEIFRKKGIPGNDVRIEHASLVTPDVMKELSSYGPHIVVQPHFLVSDWWLTNALPKHLLRWAYPFRTMVENGLILYGSSDYPVEPLNPYLGISAAVTRGLLRCVNGEEELGIDEAVRMYLRDPCFGDSLIREGSNASFLVLGESIESINPYDISALKPQAVFLNGRFIEVGEDLLNQLK